MSISSAQGSLIIRRDVACLQQQRILQLCSMSLLLFSTTSVSLSLQKGCSLFGQDFISVLVQGPLWAGVHQDQAQ